MADGTEPWVALTQNSLGSIIKAPKLTEKLLVKPPFRFLHDIVTSFMKTTGMLGGLYTDDELDSGKVSEKEAKIIFLQKLVTVVQFATSETLLVKPTKVISGSEPEHTNALLVKLATVATLPPGVVADAVAKTVGRVGGAASPPAAEAPAAEAKPGKGPSTLAQAKAAALEARRRDEEATAAAAAPPPAAAEFARPGTATARKAPPPVRSNAFVEDRPLEASQPVAGVIVEKRTTTTGASLDADADGDDADDWRKVAERHETNRAAAAGLQAAEGEGARGYLARQAQEAKREQEEAAQRAARERLEGGAGDGGIVIKMRKRADGQGAMGDSDIVKLREQLQLLTKASNPLGKFLEGIHEDVDTMLRELDMWRAEARTQRTAAREAQQQTQEALRDVNAQLSGLDDQMADQRQKVNIVRASIQRNEATIEKLIRMVVQPDKK